MENASSRYYTEAGCKRIGRFFVPELTAICMVMAIRICEDHGFLVPKWKIHYGHEHELKDTAEETIGYLETLMSDCESCSTNLAKAFEDLETTVTMHPSRFEEQISKAESEKMLAWYVSMGVPQDTAEKQTRWAIECLFKEREVREKLVLQNLDLPTAVINFPK